MDALIGNAIVGQSGGPTSAINATLVGVIRAASESKTIKKLYGMCHGIEGLLKNKIVDLTYLYKDCSGLDMMKNTPASALGSCRIRLPDMLADNEIYEKIFDIFKRYDIRYFFYIGGNDSMDTVKKLSEYARLHHYDIRIIGIPKTIDNDLFITDHTPGYGSCAKYIAVTIKEIAMDISVYSCDAVTVVEIMGRDSGWLTASAGLPSYFGCEGADLIYLPEVPFDNEKFIKSLKAELSKKPSVLVAVSEGVRYSDGTYVGASKQSNLKDAFGHQYLSGASRVLEQLVREEIGCKVRSIELSLPQRCASHLASYTDICESEQAGAYAVRCAELGENGKMVIFKRIKEKYGIELDCYDVCEIANKIKYVPRSYINQEGNNVTKECMEYIAPLILGEPNIKYENGLPVHFKIRGL